MKKLLAIAALIVAGCSEAPAPAPPPVVPQPIEIQPMPPKVEPAPTAPTPPVAPSKSAEFMNGYWDAFTGKAPAVKWLYNEDYREGRREGGKDRSAGVEPRYER